MVVCGICGGTQIEVDTARGDSVCVKCGNVMEDNMIVAEVSYTDASSGGGTMIGQFVTAEGFIISPSVRLLTRQGTKSFSLGPGLHHGFGRDSRALTIANGMCVLLTTSD